MAIPAIPNWGLTTYFTALDQEEEKLRQRRLKNAEAFNKYVEANVKSGTKLNKADLRRYINMISGDDAMFDASYPDQVLRGLSEDQQRRAGGVLEKQAFDNLTRQTEQANLIRGAMGSLLDVPQNKWEDSFVTMFGEEAGRKLFGQYKDQVPSMMSRHRQDEIERALGQAWVSVAEDPGAVEARIPNAPAYIKEAIRDRIALNNRKLGREAVREAFALANAAEVDWSLMDERTLRAEATTYLNSIDPRFATEENVVQLMGFLEGRKQTIIAGQQRKKSLERNERLATIYQKIDNMAIAELTAYDASALRDKAIDMLKAARIRAADGSVDEDDIEDIVLALESRRGVQATIEARAEADEAEEKKTLTQTRAYAAADAIAPGVLLGLTDNDAEVRATWIWQGAGEPNPTQEQIDVVKARLLARSKTHTSLHDTASSSHLVAFLQDPKSLYFQTLIRGGSEEELLAAAIEDGKQYGITFNSLEEVKTLLGQRSDLQARFLYYQKQQSQHAGDRKFVRDAVVAEFGHHKKTGEYVPGQYQKHMLDEREHLTSPLAKSVWTDLMTQYYIPQNLRSQARMHLQMVADKHKGQDNPETAGQLVDLMRRMYGLTSIEAGRMRFTSDQLDKRGIVDIPLNSNYTQWEQAEVRDAITHFQEVFVKDITDIEAITPKTGKQRTKIIENQVAKKKVYWLNQIDEMERKYRQKMQDHIFAFKKGTGEVLWDEHREGSILSTFWRFRTIIQAVTPTGTVKFTDMNAPESGRDIFVKPSAGPTEATALLDQQQTAPVGDSSGSGPVEPGVPDTGSDTNTVTPSTEPPRTDALGVARRNFAEAQDRLNTYLEQNNIDPSGRMMVYLMGEINTGRDSELQGLLSRYQNNPESFTFKHTGTGQQFHMRERGFSNLYRIILDYKKAKRVLDNTPRDITGASSGDERLSF